MMNIFFPKFSVSVKRCLFFYKCKTQKVRKGSKKCNVISVMGQELFE